MKKDEEEKAALSKKNYLNPREQKLFELAEKSRKLKSEKMNFRERNEQQPLKDQSYDFNTEFDVKKHEKLSMREILAKIEADTITVEEFDSLFPG